MKAQSSTLFPSYYLVPKIAQGVKLLDPISAAARSLASQTRLNPDYRMQVYVAEGGVRSEMLRNLVVERPSVREKMADNGRIRSDAETKLLLEIWSQDNIQKQLQGSFSNVNVFPSLLKSCAGAAIIAPYPNAEYK